MGRRRKNPGIGVAKLIAAGALIGGGMLLAMSAGGNHAADVDRIVKAYPASLPVAARLVALANRVGAKPEWIANVIQFESGWNPQAVNPYSGATGLIQFMKATASELGTTTSALYTMSVAQQFTYVEKYFLLARIPKPLTSQIDVFMAVFYPAAVGRGGSYAFSSAVQAVNPGIRTAQDYVNKALKTAKL